MAAAFALGERVIALADGVAYEVVGSGESVPPVDVPEIVNPEEGSAGESIVLAEEQPLEEGEISGSVFDGGCFGVFGALLFLPLAMVRRKD